MNDNVPYDPLECYKEYAGFTPLSEMTGATPEALSEYRSCFVNKLRHSLSIRDPADETWAAIGDALTNGLRRDMVRAQQCKDNELVSTLNAMHRDLLKLHGTYPMREGALERRVHALQLHEKYVQLSDKLSAALAK